MNAGDDLLRMRVIAGDHLFVDRMSYNFRRPTRGDVIVFETHGIQGIADIASSPEMADTYYIKRLVGLGGERLRIGNDRHVIVNDKRLDSGTPHFEFVYAFDPKEPPMESEFSGHLNEVVAQLFGQHLAPNFPNEKTEFVVGPNRYLAMGDNTMNSSDGRTWGDFPQEKVIGKSFFVYWPIGDTLFRGGPGATGRSFSDYDTIIASIRTKLFTLPERTVVHTGHGDSTSLADEMRTIGR